MIVVGVCACGNAITVERLRGGQYPQYCSPECLRKRRARQSREQYHRKVEAVPGFRAKTAAQCRERCRRDPERYRAINRRAEKRRMSQRRRESWRRYWSNPEPKRAKALAWARRARGFHNTLRLLWRMERASQQLETAMAEENADLAAVRESLKSIHTEQLKAELADGIRIVRGRLLRLGAILVELEERGAEPDLDRDMKLLLRKIGRGELLPDVVVRFAGNPYIIGQIKKLSPGEQEDVLALEDKEIAKRFGSSRRTGFYDGAKEPQEILARMASAGTTKDVAAILVETVKSAKDPRAVAEAVVTQLNNFLAQTQARPKRMASAARGKR